MYATKITGMIYLISTICRMMQTA